MKEYPILFSAPMVRAILDGRKTQTRRIIKSCTYGNDQAGKYLKIGKFEGENPGDLKWLADKTCPYGKKGDRLWVRETFAPCLEKENHVDAKDGYTYRVDWSRDDELIRDFKWKPCIFMPRSASRILLEITGVRVERLQDINRGDAISEGCPFPNLNGKAVGKTDPVGWYRDLWRLINGAASWDTNPWVWVIEFKRVGGL